jgi:3-oxoacyl-[acyl-carrier-protein] synthase-1
MGQIPNNEQGFPISELIPHSEPMILIDELVEATSDFARAKVTIRADSMFLNAGSGVPAWVGIEYMAQTVSALAGVTAKRRGQPVKIGFLLGTRRYDTTLDAFPLGMTLEIHVRQELEEFNGLSVFNCSISTGEPVAWCKLNVYQPQDPEQLMASRQR